MSINLVFLTDRSNYSPHQAKPYIGRSNAFIHRFPNYHTHRRFGKFGLGKAIYLYIAKMPFALSLCRRCSSYSFTTSLGLSKDAAIVIPKYHRTARKNAPVSTRTFALRPAYNEPQSVSYRIFCAGQEKTVANALFSKIESFCSVFLNCKGFQSPKLKTSS